ncbi:hypothetical protein [Actinomadura sp. KC345]|uniref:hypothetical protein n=1 Tax=Actinomadura sp. KC345 TaxID=2530371 RepID=UPI001405510E|nr:hypothetical protein [Actinomadura sp. KC345]
MSNSTRWTLVALLIVVNAVSSSVFDDSWVTVSVNAVTGVAVIALVIDYLLRRRRAQ